MARLLPCSYLSRHRCLRHLWLNADGVFANLTYTEQLDLHRYYSPAIDEPDEVHLAHRAWISKQDPSLAQRAGRAYAKLIAGGSVGRFVATRRRGRQLTVGGVALPSPDVRRIARMIIATEQRKRATDVHDDHAA